MVSGYVGIWCQAPAAGVRLLWLVSDSCGWCQAICAFGAEVAETWSKKGISICDRIIIKIFYIGHSSLHSINQCNLRTNNMINLRENSRKFDFSKALYVREDAESRRTPSRIGDSNMRKLRLKNDGEGFYHVGSSAESRSTHTQ